MQIDTSKKRQEENKNIFFRILPLQNPQKTSIRIKVMVCVNSFLRLYAKFRSPCITITLEIELDNFAVVSDVKNANFVHEIHLKNTLFKFACLSHR